MQTIPLGFVRVVFCSAKICSMDIRSLRQSPVFYAVIVACLAFAGMSLSIAFTTDARWIEWHMSRLGEGRHLSSVIFNVSMILVAGTLVTYSWAMTRTLDKSKARTFRGMIWVMALALVGVALFPFDEYPVAHNMFGYCFFFATGILMLWSVAHVKQFSRRSARIALTAAIVTFALMALHHLYSFTTLLTVELIGELLLFAWLMSIALDVDPVRKRLTVSSPRSSR